MSFLLHLLASALSVALVIAWIATRRKVALAKQRTMSDLSLPEIDIQRQAQNDPAFADPMEFIIFHGQRHPLVTRLVMLPCGQWLWRWLVAFPMAALGLVFYPLTWIIAMPLALFWWVVME
jgi:hypothetical protein